MENQKTKLEEFMKKQQHKQYNAAEIQQMLLDQALGWVVEEANDNDSLTEKVIEFSVVKMVHVIQKFLKLIKILKLKNMLQLQLVALIICIEYNESKVFKIRTFTGYDRIRTQHE